ncbi:MAG TPA: helix-turn-helix domain-containing protein [Microbacteriaceae bacterium]
MDKLELLMHPVRLRIILQLQDQQLTTAQIARALPGVSKATIYRQIVRLVDGEILEVTGEEPKRGTVERSYSLRTGAARIDEAAFAAMTTEEHRRGFTAMVASLLAEFNAYLDQQDSKPAAGPLAYGQRKLWLNTDEFADFENDMLELMKKYSGADHADNRQAFLTGLILFPAHQPGE